MSDGPEEHSLLMPFVNVTSRGGQFDDDAFTAGYEMGLLDATLAACAELSRDTVATLRVDNCPQADLIAMRHGYRAEFEQADVEGWVSTRFIHVPEEPTDAN